MAQRAPRPSQNPPPERPHILWRAPPKPLFARAFAARIVEAREKVNLTQEEVADRLGIRQSAYSKYEKRSGKRADLPPTPMPHIYLARFCEITGANIKDLLKDPR